MASINFNAAEVEPSQDFQILPEGKYEAVIADSDVKEPRSGNGKYVQIEFEVVSGEHRGRRIWRRYNIENPNPDAVRIGRADFSALCHAVNVLNPSDTCELHNLPVILTVKCKKQKDTGELENVIRGYAARSTAAAAQPAPQAQPQPQAAAPATVAPATAAAPWSGDHTPETHSACELDDHYLLAETSLRIFRHKSCDLASKYKT